MKKFPHWPLALLLMAALFIYIATLDTGFQPQELQGGDLITHQYAQVQARPSNAPGYPLYTMGGWLWFHGLRGLIRLAGTPLPNPIPILSSYSILWALISLALLYAIVIRLTRRAGRPQGDRLFATLLTTFYALTYFFWYYATTTEQYSSAIAQTLGIVYVYLVNAQWTMGNAQWTMVNGQWGGDHRPISQSPNLPIPTPRSLFLLAFLCGLSLAHMVTVAFIVPAVVILVLVDRPDLLRRPLTVLGAVASAALPLVSYLYVYIRGGAHPEWWGQGNWQSAQAWFWAFVSTAQGRDELSWGLDPARPFFRGVGFPELIWQEMSIPLLILGLIGIWFLGRRMAFLLYTTLLILFAFCWLDRFGNWYQVILPGYPLVLLGLVGINEQWTMRNAQWAQRRRGDTEKSPLHPLTPSPAHLLTAHLLTAVLLIAILWRVNASLPRADSRHRPDDTALDRAAILLDQPLPVGAGLFAAGDDALGLTYLTEIWAIRPDVGVLNRDQVAQRLADGGTVLAEAGVAPLALAELGALGAQVALTARGPDWVALRLGSEESAPAPDTLLNQAVGDGIALLGYSVQPGPTGAPVITAPPSLDLTLFWQIDPGAPPHDWSISVRPTIGGNFIPDPQGENGAIFQQDRPGPVDGLLTFSRLPAAVPLADAYRLPDAPGADGIMVILYRAVDGGFENLAEMRLAIPEK